MYPLRKRGIVTGFSPILFYTVSITPFWCYSIPSSTQFHISFTHRQHLTRCLALTGQAMLFSKQATFIQDPTVLRKRLLHGVIGRSWPQAVNWCMVCAMGLNFGTSMNDQRTSSKSNSNVSDIIAVIHHLIPI